MGVADVDGAEPAPAHVPHDAVTHQSVLDTCLTHQLFGMPRCARPGAEGHAERLPPGPAPAADCCGPPGRLGAAAHEERIGPDRAAISVRYSEVVLDLAILGLLQERGELHGYEIRKQLRDGLGLLANVSFGSLYPALARLEAAGAVETTEAPSPPEQAFDAVPPTGSLSGELAVLRARRLTARRSHGRRARKVYRITAPGRALFADLLAGTGGSDDQRSFGLRLAFARYLPAPARLALLERRKQQLVDRLAEVRAAGGDRALDVYARSVVEHMTDAVRHDIGWLDRLIDAEQAAVQRSAGTDIPATAWAARRQGDDR